MLVKCKYQTNSNTAIKVIDKETGLPVTNLTVNGPQSDHQTVYIKNYNENKGNSSRTFFDSTVRLHTYK